MSKRDVNALAALFHDESELVHMAATMSKAQELEVIKSGFVQYMPTLTDLTALLENYIAAIALS